ncbi:hypothetical protein [Leifsonia sp. NPDC058248]|uniref:hypothetical protein n=1 Tax=Leifsonia sp. NPDC058248 TaxID=3346402 RepID=UPI0036DCD360
MLMAAICPLGCGSVSAAYETTVKCNKRAEGVDDLATVIDSVNLTGWTIRAFDTCAASGVGTVRERHPNSTLGDRLAIDVGNSRDGQAQVESWLDHPGLDRC